MAGKIAKALGFPSMDDESEEEAPESKPKGAGKGEVLAMKAFMAADTAEAKCAAMKDFMELCGY